MHKHTCQVYPVETIRIVPAVRDRWSDTVQRLRGIKPPEGCRATYAADEQLLLTAQGGAVIFADILADGQPWLSVFMPMHEDEWTFDAAKFNALIPTRPKLVH